jgi:hypothetical protein
MNMNPLKTPQQKLMENAGATPASPGMLKNQQQMLLEQSGILPKFSKGKKVKKLSVKDMEAELIVNNKVPPSFKRNGKTKGK